MRERTVIDRGRCWDLSLLLMLPPSNASARHGRCSGHGGRLHAADIEWSIAR
jgi:hypothetical protein